MLTDILFSSPIMGNDDNPMPASQGSAVPGQPAVDRFAEYGGINPDIEPDLAMAMKLSMQEDENRRKAAEQEA
jgi:26S proteasome regulatory subunit N10